MTVNISASFTKESREYNGLNAIEKELIENPNEPRYAVVRFDTKFTKEVHREGLRIPTIELVHIEPLLGEAATTARELLDEAYRERSGRDQLPFDDDPDDDTPPPSYAGE